MKQSAVAQAAPAASTHPGQQFDAPLHMTRAWVRVAGTVTIGIASIALGVAGGVLSGEWLALGAGAVVAVPFLAFGWLMAWYTRKSERMIYPGEQRRPVIADGPTVVFVRDRVKTQGGYVDKDPEPVDVGLPPREAIRALRWMKANGKTSRAAVTAGAEISQPAWTKLNRALQDFGVLDGKGLTEEVDYLISQLESQIR